MNHGNSGLAHGTSGSSQMTMENTELAVKSRELELINKIASTEFNKSDFSYDLSKRKIETLTQLFLGVERKQSFLLKHWGIQKVIPRNSMII